MKYRTLLTPPSPTKSAGQTSFCTDWAGSNRAKMTCCMKCSRSTSRCKKFLWREQEKENGETECNNKREEQGGENEARPVRNDSVCGGKSNEMMTFE